MTTPTAKAQIAAALALMGGRARAEKAYAAALAALAPAAHSDPADRNHYGSTLRDAAALLALAAEGGASPAIVQAAMQRVDDTGATLRPTSTQEHAWRSLAASAIAKDASKVSLNVRCTFSSRLTAPGLIYRQPMASLSR